MSTLALEEFMMIDDHAIPRVLTYAAQRSLSVFARLRRCLMRFVVGGTKQRRTC